MIDWQEAKTRIGATLAVIRGSEILDTTARMALASIPVVGHSLVKLYDATAPDEDPTEKLALVLERLQGFDAGAFERFAESIDGFEGSLIELSGNVDRMSQRLAHVHEMTSEIHQMLVAADKQLEHLSASAVELDPEVAADRLTFFIQLGRLLDRTKPAFFQQIVLGRKLLARIPATSNHKGLDDALREVAPAIESEEDRDLFDDLRRITDHMRRVNVRMRSLLRSNRRIAEIEDLPVLNEVAEHISWWLAKYELLRDDPDMCIVFVGVDPTNKPFPGGVDQGVAGKIESLRRETQLHHT